MHFYRKDGSSMHTIVGKNGKERTTSIADARKLGLFPSVTTIMDVQAKPALIEWLQQELLNAAIDTPYHPHAWDADAWRKATLIKMRSKSRKAAERGTEIHGKLESFFSGVEVSMDKDWKYIQPTLLLIEETFGLEGWVAEKSFANTDLGFAGCVDLYHPDKNIIIDFKTKDKAELKGVKQYDDHKMQLAAYQLGLGLQKKSRRFNLFISTSSETPGMCSLIECAEFDRFVNMFLHLNEFWRLKNKYDPRKGEIE
jgi:hypothetical protein